MLLLAHFIEDINDSGGDGGTFSEHERRQQESDHSQRYITSPGVTDDGPDEERHEDEN